MRVTYPSAYVEDSGTTVRKKGENAQDTHAHALSQLACAVEFHWLSAVCASKVLELKFELGWSFSTFSS